ncbi:MAG: hypothetical protein ACLP9L_20270 [Thermoguttaceae bacterium]
MVNNCAIGVTIASVLIFAAAFMPWGEINAIPTINSPFGGSFPIPGNPFPGMNLTITITGWNGSITVGGLSLPNWLVVLASAGVATLCWLKATSVWDAPVAVLFALAGYGLLHIGVALLTLMGSGKSSAGVGSLLTALAFIGIIAILVQLVRSPKTASPPNQTL